MHFARSGTGCGGQRARGGQLRPAKSMATLYLGETANRGTDVAF